VQQLLSQLATVVLLSTGAAVDPVGNGAAVVPATIAAVVPAAGTEVGTADGAAVFPCFSEDSELDSELCESEDRESHFRCLFRCLQHLPVTSAIKKQQR
jgi:hypothetical protein